MAIEKDNPIVATEIVDALNEKVSTSDILTLEEVEAGKNLTGKIASAEVDNHLIHTKLDSRSLRGAGAPSSAFFVSIGNVGRADRTVTITLSSSEQILFLFGSGTSTSNYMTMLGGTGVADYSFGKNSLVCASKEANTITVVLPQYFRGCIFSYLPFSVAGQD